jgi:hypothetical protein
MTRTWPRRNAAGQLVPELGCWLRGGAHLRALGLDDDLPMAVLAELGWTLAQQDEPLTAEELAQTLARVEAMNEVRTRADAGGPVHERELAADAAYWRLYGLPEGCTVHWDDGMVTRVARGQDGTLHHYLPQDLDGTAPEACYPTGPSVSPPDASAPEDTGAGQPTARGDGATLDRLGQVKKKVLSESADDEQFEDDDG